MEAHALRARITVHQSGSNPPAGLQRAEVPLDQPAAADIEGVNAPGGQGYALVVVLCCRWGCGVHRAAMRGLHGAGEEVEFAGGWLILVGVLVAGLLRGGVGGRLGEGYMGCTGLLMLGCRDAWFGLLVGVLVRRWPLRCSESRRRIRGRTGWLLNGVFVLGGLTGG